MKKFILGLIFLSGVVYATDYSALSTQELMDLKGTVPTEQRDAFRSEMQSRTNALSYDEKAALGLPQQRNAATSGSGYGQKLRDGSGAGSMSRGSHSGGGKGRK